MDGGIMQDAILNTVLDYGALGVFAIYLGWISQQQSKRITALQEKYEELLKSSIESQGIVATKLEQGITEMRQHYAEEAQRLSHSE